MSHPTLDGQLMFPSNYLCAEDLKGQPMHVTITGTNADELRVEGGAMKKSYLLSIAEHAKKLVLNKTNAKTIAVMYGGEARKWRGQRITLYPTTCKLKGKTVPCIRIKDVQPSGASTPPPREDIDQRTSEPPPGAMTDDQVENWRNGADQVAQTHGWTTAELSAFITAGLRKKNFANLAVSDQAFRDNLIALLRDDEQKKLRDERRAKAASK